MRLGENRFHTVLIALLAALTAYSIVVRFQLYALGVTLWYDEGLLITNVLSQNLGELMTTPLNTGYGAQSAPLLFMAVVKLFTMAFGFSEASVRAFSFVLCMVMLVCVYIFMRKVFMQNAVFAWLAVCLTATLPLYVRYSNEMKPYMSDACFAVVILLLYYFVRSGRMNLFVYAILCAVIIFFSTPSVFFIAGVFLAEFLSGLKSRKYKKLLFVALAGLIAAAAFVLHYMFWLRSTATDSWMVDFWAGHSFVLPFSAEAIRTDLALSVEYLSPFGVFKYAFLAFGLLGYIISLFERKIHSIAVGFAFILLLAASSVGMYPIISRLWLFTFVICIIYAVYFIAHIRIKTDNAAHAKISTAVIAIVFSAMLLAGNASFPDYAKGETDNIYPGMNVNPLIEYVRENIREGETLYSFETATPILWFKNGYENYRIGDVSEDNIILGRQDPDKDVSLIAETSDVWVLYNRGYLPFSMDYRVVGLSEDLSRLGYMDRVLDINNTPLFWFTTDITHLKTAAEISMQDSPEGQTIVRVANTGSTILETPDSALARGSIGPVRLVCKLYADGKPAEERDLSYIPAPILPGEQAEVEVSLGDISGADRVVIDLVSEGRFSFSETGMEPIELGETAAS